ncbi:rhomboid family intramembrane serine protease [Maricaulaceae bacterium MS644]
MTQTPDPRGPAGTPEPPVQRPAPRGPTPIFNMMAPVILLLAGLMLAVQLSQSWTMSGRGGGMIHGITLWLGTIRTGGALGELPPAPLFGLTPYVLHVFVHFGWLHLLMNLGALLAFGPAAARPFGRGWKSTPGFLIFFFACAIGGAIATSVVNAGEASIMAGSSTAISGVIAGAGFAAGGRSVMQRIALPWLVINLALAAGDLFFPIPIAWEGHIGGLVTGFALYPLMVRYLVWR